MVCQRIMLSWPLIIDINVKNIKMYFPEKGCHLGTNRSDNET